MVGWNEKTVNKNSLVCLLRIFGVEAVTLIMLFAT